MKQLLAALRSGAIRSDNMTPVSKRDVRFAGEMFLRAASNDVFWRGCSVEGCRGKHCGRGLCAKHRAQTLRRPKR